jgi:hypothetical protein
MRGWLAAELTCVFGVLGTAFSGIRETQRIGTALGLYELEELNFRERDAYLRLRDLTSRQIEVQHIQQLIDFEDDFLAVAMTVVNREVS